MYKDKPCEKCAKWGTCHSDDFYDRHWLKSHGYADCWEIGEINDNNTLIFPQTIGDITYYNKEELFEWVEKQQEINNKYQIKLELSQPEIEKLMTDMSGTLNIGILDCSDIPEEEIDRIINR